MSSFIRMALIAGLLAGPVFAQSGGIRSAGVLGNSGEAGDTLVRYSGVNTGRNPVTGLGVDASGFLWTLGGMGAVNRYSVDGRMLATYPTPKKMQRPRYTLTVIAGQVILLAGEKLWTLPVNAPSGTEFTALPVDARTMSIGPVGNRIALISTEGNLSIYDVVTRQSEPRGKLPEGVRGNSIALLGDGSLIIDRELKLSVEGQPTKLDLPGTTPVWLGNSLYVFTGHTTIHRLNATGSPDPGVVLGGSSGSFIGTLPKDGEINTPSGLVQLGGDRYATTAALGVIQILRWDDQKKAFEGVRRIGAIHRSSGLGVDRQGRVWWNCGYWNWADGPAELPHDTLNMTEGESWQMAFLESDAMTGLAKQNNKWQLYCGVIAPTPRERYDRTLDDAAASIPENPTGATVLGSSGKEEGVYVNAAGKGVRLSLAVDGKLRTVKGKFTLKTAGGKAPAITSLGSTPKDNVIAADNGAIIRLNAAGDTWTETARYAGWGTEKFGKTIYLTTDGDRLWVSDTDNNRVLLFALTEDGPLTAPKIYTTDAIIGALKSPGRIAARSDRAVVVDEGNQRLVKLEVAAP